MIYMGNTSSTNTNTKNDNPNAEFNNFYNDICLKRK